MAATLPLQPPPSFARHWLKLLEWTCRAGYAARGFVYVATGLISVLAAIGLAPRPRGPLAALEAWAQWPLGFVLIGFAGIGLWAFAGWRALQSIFDVEGQGAGPHALMVRAGQAISGIVYGLLAASAFSLIDAMAHLHRVDEQAQTGEGIIYLLALPGGEALVIAAGVFVIVCGVGNLMQAVMRDFGRTLECSDAAGRNAAVLGRLGYAARGLVFLPVGLSISLAGLHARSSEVRGAGAALSGLRALPFGDALLGFAGAGLIAFGLFGFVEARWRNLGLIRSRPETEPRFVR